MRVVILFGVDKMRAPAIARMLQTYPTRVATSMGTKISHSSCLVCDKQIKKESDMCEHLLYHRGQRVRGKIAGEYLYGLDFYEQSIVSVPAAPRAMVVDIISDIVPGRLLKVAAETGNSSQTQIINTLYDMIKTAKTENEKNRFSNKLDSIIAKLEALNA
jgi:hypothetical protein